MRTAGCLVAALAIPAAAFASDKPAKVAITSASADGAVIVRAAPLTTEYKIVLSAFDPVKSETRSSPLGGWSDLAISGDKAAGQASAAPAFFVRRLKPGSYVIHSLTQQNAWANCYHADTRQFTVAPGQLLLLGDFDGPSSVAQLQRNALLHGNLMARGGEFHHYFEGIAPPAITPPDAAMIEAAAAFVRERMPRTTATVTAATLAPARFGTGRTLFGARICGGYLKQKVAPAGAGSASSTS